MSKYIIKTAIDIPDKPIADIDKLLTAKASNELATAIKDNLIYYKLKDNKAKLDEYKNFLNEKTYIDKLKKDVTKELKNLYDKVPTRATINTLLDNMKFNKLVLEETEMNQEELENFINDVGETIKNDIDENISISDTVKTSLTDYKELNEQQKQEFINEFVKEIREPIFDKLLNVFSYLKWDEFKEVLEINKKVVTKFIGIALVLLISATGSGSALTAIIRAIVDATKRQYNDENNIKNYNIKK